MPAKSFCFLWVFLCLLSGSLALSAQEIRWKFLVGDEFVVSQRQTSSIDTLVEKRKSKINSSVTLRSRWKVSDVDDQSVATIEQTIDGIKITIDNPADNTKSVAIDTASDAKPSKDSRGLLKQLKPLIGMTFILKMSNRGEVMDVSVPEETQQLLDAIPADSWANALLDPVKLKGQIQNASFALPKQDLSEGQSIEISRTQNPTPATAAPLGKRKMTYNGQRTIDGQEADIFLLSTVEQFDSVKAKPASDGQLASQPDVATFDWNGEMRFDRDEGHCLSCKQQTTIATSRSYRDMEMSTSVVVETIFQLQRK